MSQTLFKTRDFRITDILKISPRTDCPGMSDGIKEAGNEYYYAARLIDYTDNLITILYDNKILAIVGYVALSDRDALIVSLIDNDFSTTIKKAQLSFFKFCRSYLEEIPHDLLLATVVEGFTQGERFVEAHGFIKGAIDPTTNSYIYSKVNA